MAYTLHLITPDEWPELQRLGELPSTMPAPSSIVVAVKDDQGRIIARWFAVDTVALEGLFIEPTYRTNPVVVKKLFLAMIDVLRKKGVQEAITLIQSDDVRKLARTAGFDLLQGELWRLDLDKD